jgi:hypothetical protein
MFFFIRRIEVIYFIQSKTYFILILGHTFKFHLPTPDKQFITYGNAVNDKFVGSASNVLVK